MSDTFVTLVVCIHEELLPAVGQCLGVDRITVVLRCDVALAGKQVGAGNVGTAVTELHLDSASTRCAGQQLVTKTDTENWCPSFVHGRLDVLDRGLHHSWITRAVGDEETVILFASKLREVVVPRDLQHLDSSLYQASQLVVFETDVDGNDTHGAARGVLEGSGRVGGPELGLLDGNWKLSG
ncbi:hypothetical protein P3342_010536 [Pyrenophora teres f. teres]|nr:hypothetical protein P3342_010536 [Pyrenophora teres f. teres]